MKQFIIFFLAVILTAAAPAVAQFSAADVLMASALGITVPSTADTTVRGKTAVKAARARIDAAYASIDARIRARAVEMPAYAPSGLASRMESRLNGVEAALAAYDAALISLVPDSLTGILSAGLSGQPSYGDLLAEQGKLAPVLRKEGLGNVARKSDVDDLKADLEEILRRLPPATSQ